MHNLYGKYVGSSLWINYPAFLRGGKSLSESLLSCTRTSGPSWSSASSITPSWLLQSSHLFQAISRDATHLPPNTNRIMATCLDFFFFMIHISRWALKPDPDPEISCTSQDFNVMLFLALRSWVCKLTSAYLVPPIFGGDPAMQSSLCLSFTQIPPTQGIDVTKSLGK